MTKKQTQEIAESKYSTDELAGSGQFREYRDLLEALLDKEKEYTQAEAKEIVEKYMKGKVR